MRSPWVQPEVEALNAAVTALVRRLAHPLLHVKEHGLQRAARSPSAWGERWRARPGCGGERGRETNRPCRSALHGPPPPQLKKSPPHASRHSPPHIQGHHSQMRIDWFDMILLYYEKKTEQMNFKNLAPMFHLKIHVLLRIGPSEHGFRYLQRGGGPKKRFQNCLDRYSAETIVIPSSNSRPLWRENTVIQHCRTMCCYRATSPSTSTTLEAPTTCNPSSNQD